MVCQAHNIFRPISESSVGKRRKSTARPIDGNEARADSFAELVPATANDATPWKTVEHEDYGIGGVCGAVSCEAKGARIGKGKSLTFFGSKYEFGRIWRRRRGRAIR